MNRLEIIENILFRKFLFVHYRQVIMITNYKNGKYIEKWFVFLGVEGASILAIDSILEIILNEINHFFHQILLEG